MKWTADNSSLTDSHSQLTIIFILFRSEARPLGGRQATASGWTAKKSSSSANPAQSPDWATGTVSTSISDIFTQNNFPQNQFYSISGFHIHFINFLEIHKKLFIVKFVFTMNE